MAAPRYTAPDFKQPPFAGAPAARFAPLPADGVLPEDFFSTSNLPTYVHLGGGQWLMPPGRGWTASSSVGVTGSRSPSRAASRPATRS